MKKILMFCMVALLMLPFVVKAQGSLTVADGTETNAYIPVYGFWADAAQHSQMIYPESMLTDMVGNAVESLTFYSSNSSVSWGSAVFSVKMAIVADSVFSTASFNTTAATTVYSGSLSISSNQMVITCENQFIYTGGHLLIDVEETTTGTYSSSYFTGIENIAVSSIYAYNSNSPTTLSFLPKLTFVYTTPPTCPNPSALSFSNVTANSADFSWTSNGSETNWDIYETTTATDVPDASSTPTATAATTPTYALSGLTSSTNYYLYVRANCGAGDVSAWRGAMLRTSQVPATLPYTQDFEDSGVSENANWDIQGSGDNQWVIGSAVNTTAEGQNALYVSNDNGTSYLFTNTSESVSWAYRDIDFGNYAEYNLSFNLKVGGSYYSPFRVYIGTPATPPASSVAPQGATQLGEFYLIEDWTEESFVLGPTYSGVQRLYFMWYNNGSPWYGGTNPPPGIDDISLVGVNCYSPVSPVVDSITTNSISFHFTSGSALNDAWQAVLYSANDTTTVDLTDTYYTFANLTPDTYYSIYVRTVCDEEYSNWVHVTSSRTSCATVVAPYTESFSGFDANPSPCWQQFQGLFADTATSLSSTTYGWYFSSTNVFPLGHPRLNIYGTSVNKWLVSPAIDLSALTNPALYFDLALTKYGTEEPIADPTLQQDDKFMVIISTDDGTTWRTVDATIWSNDSTADYVYNNISNLGDEVMLSLAQYANQTIRIAFYGESTVSGGDNDLHIANVSVNEMANCIKPSSIAVTGSTTTTINVVWTAGDDEETWNLEYKAADDEDWTVVNALTTTSYQIDNLEAGTVYAIRVQSDCGPDGVSGYRELQGGAHTETCDSIDRCMIILEMEDEYGDGWNGNTINIYENGVLTHSSTIPYGYYTAVDTVYVCDNANLSLVWVEGNYSDEASFIVKNNFGETVYTCTDGSDLSDGQIFHNEVYHCTPPDCWKPATVNCTDATNDGFTVNWTRNAHGGNESAWNLEYKAVTESDWTSIAVVDTFYTLSGLDAATYYDVRVQADCGAGSTSDWTATVARTALCELENQCTYILTLNTAYSGYWNYGDGAVQVWSDSILLGTYTIEGSALSQSFDLSLCHESVLQLKAAVGQYWSMYGYGEEVSLSLANSEGVVLFTQGGANWYNNYTIYTDTMDCTPPACPRPSDVAVSNIQATTAQLSWTETGSASEWIIEYMATVDTAWTTVNATSNPYSLTNLLEGNKYSLRMRAFCGGTDTSEYTGIVNFIMNCEAKTLPYSENFDVYTDVSSSSGAPDTYPNSDYPMCWSFLNMAPVNGDYPQAFLTSMSSYAVSGNALFFKSSSTTPIYSILPTFEQTIDNLQVTFKYRNESTGSYNGILSVGYIVDPSDANSFVEMVSLPQITTLTEVTVLFDTVTEQNALIAFKYMGGQSNNYYLSIDNVVVEEIPSCIKPSDLMATATTATSISVSWVEHNTATSWDVVYGPAGFDPASEGTPVTVNADTYTITNLQPSTLYDVYVRSNCTAADQSIWSDVLRCATECVVIDLPYTENFDSYTGTSYNTPGVAPICWVTTTNNTSYPAPHITNGGSYSYPLSAPNAMTFTCGSAGADAYAVLPEFTDALNTVEMAFAFETESSTSGTMTVGYVTDMDSIEATFTVVATLSNSSGAIALDTVSFASVPAGTTGRLAFHWNYSSSYFSCSIDNISVYVGSPTSTCDVPTALTVSNVTDNSAAVSWTAGGDETAWNLQYKKANESAWSSSIATTAPNYALTALDAETAYQVRVQANCGAGETSEWTAAANFTTAPVDPCNAPTNLQVTGTTENTATITWTAGGTETAWKVQYKLHTASEWTEAAATATTYTISGLTAATAYDVQVYAICSATAISDPTAVVNFTTAGTGISNVELANSISIMPNPAESYIELTVNSNVNVKEAAIYNAFGQLIQMVTLTDNHARIDVSGMAVGMYFVRIANDSNMATKKFIKK